MFKDLVGPGIRIQPLRIDLERGEWVFLATLAPGVRAAAALPHRSGPGVDDPGPLGVPASTPTSRRSAGSYLYEPGGSVHTFFCPADNTEDTVALAWIEGAQVSFNEDGTLPLGHGRRHHPVPRRDRRGGAGHWTGPLHPHGGTAAALTTA